MADGQANERAVEAASWAETMALGRLGYDAARAALAAAHDPALGLDRSVCLRDVVEGLRAAAGHPDQTAPIMQIADVIEQWFAAPSPAPATEEGEAMSARERAEALAASVRERGYLHSGAVEQYGASPVTGAERETWTTGGGWLIEWDGRGVRVSAPVPDAERGEP